MKNNTKQGNDALIGRTFGRYLALSILITLSATLGMMIDNVIAGNLLGADAVAAIGMSLPIFMLFSGCAGILETGAVALSARAMGKRDLAKVNSLFSMAVSCGLVVGVLLSVGGFVGSGAIASALGASDSVLHANTTAYLSGICCGAFAVVLLQIMMGFTRLDNAPSLGLLAIIVMSLCDVCFNLVAVLVLDAGLFGMGAATALAYCVALVVCGSHLFSKKNTLKFVSPLGQAASLGRMLATGVPDSLSRACVMCRTMLFNALLLAVAGSGAVAALSMLSSVNNFVCSVAIGTGQTATLLGGIFFGEEDRGALKATLRAGLRYGLVLCCLVACVVFAFAPEVVGLFGLAGSESADFGVVAVRAYCLSAPICLINSLFVYYYQSTGNLKAANLVTFGESFGFPAIFAVCTVWFWGATGVWFAFLAGEGAVLVVQLIVANALWSRRKGGVQVGDAPSAGDASTPGADAPSAQHDEEGATPRHPEVGALAGGATPRHPEVGALAGGATPRHPERSALAEGAESKDPSNTSATFLDKMMYLPAGFQSDWKDVRSWAFAADMDAVVCCSRELQEWCVAGGMDARRAFQVSLAVEEMAGNIARHGAVKGKAPFVEVKAIVKDDGELVLRLRDDGRAFNPLDYDIDADGFSCIGIRLIRKSLDRIEYHNTVGLNNLLIVLPGE